MKITHNATHPLVREVERIIERADQSRLDIYGGYPSSWIILGDLVIWADPVGHREGKVDLIVENIEEFVKEWQSDDEEEIEANP
jgi:hypothetical protein